MGEGAQGAALGADAVEYPDEVFEPIKIGPTWQKNDDGSWCLPEHTLGWEIAAWAAKWLNADESDEENGARVPWKFTTEQLRWLLWWYAVDERGQFVHRTGVLQRLKGWGKDPLGAVVCLAEMVGPVRFAGWSADGRPVGKPHPKAWVQIAAVSKDQTKNTMTLLPALMSKAFVQEYDVDAGKELVRANGGKAMLEAVTSNYRSLEGGRATFVLMNETHHWVTGNMGTLMYETVDGNVTKGNKALGGSRYLAITNAPLPGEDSVAERMRDEWEAVQEGRYADTGMMYDSLEAHDDAPLDPEVLPRVLEGVRGDATWLDIPGIISSIMKRSISPARSRRMWLNQIRSEADAVYEKSSWTKIRADNAELLPGDTIVLGFDGSRNDDSTALIAIRVEDDTVFPIRVDEKPEGPQGDDWEVDAEGFSETVYETFSMYNVVGFYADVHLWESYISDWAKHLGEGLLVKSDKGRNAIAWDMRGSLRDLTRTHEALMRAVLDEKLAHDGDPVMQRHALNARRSPNFHGLYFRKESADSPKKTDAYAALVLAYRALMDLRTRGKKDRKRSGRVYMF